VLVALLLAIGIYMAVDALFVSDTERVEAEIGRLLDVARAGGEGAADEILAALADDYRGEGPFARASVERYVRGYLAGGPPEELLSGDYEALWIGDEIVVPILSLRAKRKGVMTQLPILRVHFAERDGRFRVTYVSQWRLER